MEISKMAYNFVNLSPFGCAKVVVGTYLAYKITKKVMECIPVLSWISPVGGVCVGVRAFVYLLKQANPELNNAQQEKLVKIFFSIAEQADQYVQQYHLKT